AGRSRGGGGDLVTSEPVTPRAAGVGRAAPSQALRRGTCRTEAPPWLPNRRRPRLLPRRTPIPPGKQPSRKMRRRREDRDARVCDARVLYYPVATWYSARPFACCSAGKVPGKASSGARFHDGSGGVVGLCVGLTQHRKPGKEKPR